MNPDAAPNSPPPATPRLSPETRLSLREVSGLLGEKGHAVIWATNYQLRHGVLPDCSQIVIGLDCDLGVKISGRSAERALQDIRARGLSGA